MRRSQKFEKISQNIKVLLSKEDLTIQELLVKDFFSNFVAFSEYLLFGLYQRFYRNSIRKLLKNKEIYLESL